jgi:hypothetical protein
MQRKRRRGRNGIYSPRRINGHREPSREKVGETNRHTWRLYLAVPFAGIGNAVNIHIRCIRKGELQENDVFIAGNEIYARDETLRFLG